MDKIKIFFRNHQDFMVIFSIIVYIFSIIISENFVYGNLIPKYYFSLIRYSVLLLCLFKIFFLDFKEFTNNTKVRILLLFLILFLVSLFNNNRTFFQLLVLIVASYNINFDKIAKNILIYESFLIILIMLLSFLGIVPNLKFGRVNSEIIRYGLGFSYCTFPSIAIFSLSLLFLYYKRNRINFYDYFILTIINVGMFILTNSRMELLSYFLAVISFLAVKYIKNISKVISFFAKYVLIILIFASILISITYNESNNTYKNINNVFSDRFYLWNSALKNNDISLFGNEIDYYDIRNIDNKGYIIDNSFLDIIISNGVIVSFIIFVIHYIFIRKKIKENNEYIQIVYIVIMLHSFINPDLLMIKYNLFILMLSDILIKTRKISTEELVKSNLTIEEVHNLHKKMIRTFNKFCNANKLNYYICGGTLLGAIRHNGFIPWDDDVDILMPRNDYERIQELVKYKFNNKIQDNLLLSSLKNGTSKLPFLKLYNLDYIVEEEFIDVDSEEYLWIDIFPMDGLSENEKDNIKLYNRIKYLRKILRIRLLKDETVVSSSTTKIKAMLKPFVKYLIDILPVSFYSGLIDYCSQKYSFNKSKYVGGVMWGYGPQEKLLRKYVEKRVKVDFEGMKLYTFSCWDEYLTNLYGNYMKLPPKKDRTTHLANIRKADKNEEKSYN